MILFCREFGRILLGILICKCNSTINHLINVEKWVGLDRNTIRRMNFRGLTLIPTPRKSVNKIMGKLLKRYWMLTQANMKKTKIEPKFEPAKDIRAD